MSKCALRVRGVRKSPRQYRPAVPPAGLRSIRSSYARDLPTRIYAYFTNNVRTKDTLFSYASRFDPTACPRSSVLSKHSGVKIDETNWSRC